MDTPAVMSYPYSDAPRIRDTSASWAAIRLQDKPDSLTARTAFSYPQLVKMVQELEAEHDLIVIDAPPRIAEMQRQTDALQSGNSSRI
jgi:hypothetical protein